MSLNDSPARTTTASRIGWLAWRCLPRATHFQVDSFGLKPQGNRGELPGPEERPQTVLQRYRLYTLSCVNAALINFLGARLNPPFTRAERRVSVL